MRSSTDLSSNIEGKVLLFPLYFWLNSIFGSENKDRLWRRNKSRAGTKWNEVTRLSVRMVQQAFTSRFIKERPYSSEGCRDVRPLHCQLEWKRLAPIFTAASPAKGEDSRPQRPDAKCRESCGESKDSSPSSSYITSFSCNYKPHSFVRSNRLDLISWSKSNAIFSRLWHPRMSRLFFQVCNGFI